MSTSPAGNVAATMAEHALATTKALGINPRDISVPRPSASPEEVTQSHAQGYVTPLYDAAPAPTGLAYYGLSEGQGGAVVPTILNTTSLFASVTTNPANGPGIVAQDLFASSPDSYGVQLNAVAPNVTLFGQPGYSFWTQNVVEYYPQTDFMIIVSNIWNFSGASISSNSLYSTTLTPVDGGFITDDFGIQGLLGYYYSEAIVPFPVSYPFALSLYMNSSLSDGRNAVTFTVGVTSSANPSEDFMVPYDQVVFNSIATDGPALTVPSNYTANGYSYNPIGLTNDFELDICGPGGGSNADLQYANATLALAYWNSQSGSYQATPSAFNYGGETGETATGANVAWADGAGGPSGLSDWGTMSAGPSILRGLWNAGAPEGSVPVTFDITPSNAFITITPVNSSPSLEHFLYAQPYAESDLYGPTFWLTPGTYTVKYSLSNYDREPAGDTTLTLHVVAPSGHHHDPPKVVTRNLHYNPLVGVYTPLWAFSNSELPGISSSGAGTMLNPYMLFNNQYRTLPKVFGLYNDYGFPVYPGVFLSGTTAYTYLEHAPSFTTQTSTFEYPGSYLPSTNELQFWFWSVSNFALLYAPNITGWFDANTYYPTVWDTFNVVFYNSSNNLIAQNQFDTESQALLLFSGGSIFGPVNTGGGDNTIWANTFDQGNAPPSSLGLMPFGSGLGLQLAESGDLIYNNWFATPTTAWMLPLNMYSGDPYLYTDTWNITPIKASQINYAPGFPLVPLTGSIVGGGIQGGNFWWDYGTTAGSPNPYNGAVNPYGVIPYDENATTLLVYIYGPSYYYATYIYNGGDYAPFSHPHIHLG